MSFDTYGASQNEASNHSKVDWDKLNRYVVEVAQLQQRETLVGYVSNIVDLGTQEQPDSEVVFTGTEEDERKEIAERPQTYFKDGYDYQTKKDVRLKCWPNKPVQCVAFSVDFPDIIIDKGQFFGESKPLPLRLWYGGEFYSETYGMTIARPTPLKVNKSLGDWSFDVKHLFYKMAVDSKIINPGEIFVPSRINELLGKAFQWQAQVFYKKAKTGKEYYTEWIKYVSGLGRGQSSPEIITPLGLVQFNRENDPSVLKELRSHVVNTMKRASNYEGSLVKSQIESVRGVSGGSQNNNSNKGTQERASQNEASDAPWDDDSDTPF